MRIRAWQVGLGLLAATGSGLADEVRGEQVTDPADDAAPSHPDRKTMTPPWQKLPDPNDAAAPPPQTEFKGQPSEAEASVKPLRWFVRISLGYASPSYDRYYQAVSSFQSATNGTGFAISSDLGYYGAFFASNLLLGLGYQSITDLHLGTATTNGSVATFPFIYQGRIGASAMQFFGVTRGAGFYLRADAGYGFVATGTSSGYASFSGVLSGLGLLGGLGYGFELGQHVRLLLGGECSTLLFLPDNPIVNFGGGASVVLAF